MRSTTLTAREKSTLAVSCLTVALVIGSMAALYTSLGEIAGETGATQTELTWVIDGYTLALACLLLPAGAIGDRYGRRAVLIAGLAVFAAASVIPLCVSEPVWLIVSRVVAGVGAAFMMPSTLSIMTATFPAAHRGRAVGVWAGVAGSGAILGMLCSGLLLQWWTWEAIFIGFVAAGLALLLAACTLPESRQPVRHRLDLAGSLTVIAALALIVVGLIEAPERGWTDPVTLGFFAGGAIAAAVFAAIELRIDHPLLELRLFRDRNFGGGTLTVGLQFLVMFGLAFLIVQYVQLVLGYGAWQSAVAIAPIGVPLVGISAVAPWLGPRIGLRLLAVGGFLLVAAGLYLTSRLTVDAVYVDILWPLLLMGAGMGLSMAPATTAIMTASPEDDHGAAAAVNDAAREVGAAVGIAIAGSVLAAGYVDRIAAVLPQLPAQVQDPVSDSPAAALQIAESMGPAAARVYEGALSAFVHGHSQAALVLALATLASTLLLALWIPEREPAPYGRHAKRDDPPRVPVTAA